MHEWQCVQMKDRIQWIVTDNCNCAAQQLKCPICHTWIDCNMVSDSLRDISVSASVAASMGDEQLH